MPEVGIDREAVFGARQLDSRGKHCDVADSGMVLVLASKAKCRIFVSEVSHELRFRVLVW